jgi:hypothetical protein
LISDFRLRIWDLGPRDEATNPKSAI